MKAYEYWAKGESHALKSREEAYIAGFKRGRQRAASMLELFGNEKLDSMAILISAIGNAEVDENGKPESDRE